MTAGTMKQQQQQHKRTCSKCGHRLHKVWGPSFRRHYIKNLEGGAQETGTETVSTTFWRCRKCGNKEGPVKR